MHSSELRARQALGLAALALAASLVGGCSEPAPTSGADADAPADLADAPIPGEPFPPQALPAGTTADEAREILASASVLCLRATRATVVSKEARALLLLLRDPEAARHFTMLTESENLVAVTYGLCGLRLLDENLFQEHVLALSRDGDPDRVQRTDGCIGSSYTRAELRTRIEDGTLPKEFLAAERELEQGS